MGFCRLLCWNRGNVSCQSSKKRGNCCFSGEKCNMYFRYMTKGSLPLTSLYKIITSSLKKKAPFEAVFFFINGKIICKQSKEFTNIPIKTISRRANWEYLSRTSRRGRISLYDLHEFQQFWLKTLPNINSKCDF